MMDGRSSLLVVEKELCCASKEPSWAHKWPSKGSSWAWMSNGLTRAFHYVPGGFS